MAAPENELFEALVAAVRRSLRGRRLDLTETSYLAVAAVLRALPQVAWLTTARGADVALVELDVESMHKVIGGAVLAALADLVPQ